MISFFLFIGNFFVILLFIGFSVLIVLNPFMMKGVSLEEYSNDYCQSEEAVTDPNDPLSLVCNNKYKKDKFIWVLIDGLAYDQLVKMPQLRKEYNLTNFFIVESNDYKQSGSLHETILTGKFSRNYPAQETVIDHILKQASACNQTMNFVGSKFPLYYLLGEEASKVLNDSVIKYSESHAIETLCPSSMLNIYDGFATNLQSNFSDGRYLHPNITPQYVYDVLLTHYGPIQKEIKKKFDYCMEIDHFKSKPLGSLIYYTSKIDHYNHSFDKRNINTIFNIFSVEMSLLGVREWIDLHPEYALIISSDHGGQRYNGQDDICNHGCNEKGNEAILLVYTKELGTSYNTFNMKLKTIMHNNIAPTVSQILKNVNIPLEAQGLAHELSNDNVVRFAAVKSKEIQLIQYIKKYILKFPNKQIAMEKYITKLTQSDFSNKIATMDLLNQMDDVFYHNYQQFLFQTQQEIASRINKDTTSYMLLFVFYSIISFILGKICFELKYLRAKLSIDKLEKAHYLLISLIGIAFLFEVILSFVFYNVNVNKIIIISRFIEGFILFLAALLYFKLFSFEKKHLELGLAWLFIGVSIVGMVMVKYDLFPLARFFFAPTDKRFLINIALIYPLALIYLFYDSYSLSHLYLCSKPKLKVSYFLYALSVIVVAVMFSFDKDLNEIFFTHTKYRKWLVRAVYGIICFYFLLSFIPLYELKHEKEPKEGEENSQSKKVKAHVLLKIPMFLYVFFISDEAERLLMFFAYFPLNELFTKQLMNKTVNIYWKIICICFLLMIPDILYITSQNTFSFDISLRVTIKCFGSYADETPILTGVLMGTHKLKFFMMTSAYLLRICPLSTMKFMKGNSALIRIILDIQMGFMICLYLFFVVSGYEEHYLQIFMWIMTKCMISVIFDLDYFFCYFIHICNWKCCFRWKSPMKIEEYKFEQIIEMKDKPSLEIINI